MRSDGFGWPNWMFDRRRSWIPAPVESSGTYMHLNIKCLSRIKIKPRVRSSMLSIYPYVKLWKLHVWTIVFTWNVLSDEFHEMNTKIIISSSSVIWLWKWWLPINRGFQFVCNECIHISISRKCHLMSFFHSKWKLNGKLMLPNSQNTFPANNPL